MCEITAHSGCDGTPDNSMEFVRYALASEGNCLEADIRRNRDGELILSHDETAEEAVRLGQVFELLKEKTKDIQLKKVGYGIFQADMKVELLNDGPITILLDSSKMF